MFVYFSAKNAILFLEYLDLFTYFSSARQVNCVFFNISMTIYVGYE
jgi:hypothetical protein